MAASYYYLSIEEAPVPPPPPSAGDTGKFGFRSAWRAQELSRILQQERERGE
jgi:hypothetical protein